MKSTVGSWLEFRFDPEKSIASRLRFGNPLALVLARLEERPVDPLAIDFGTVELGDTEVYTGLSVISSGTAPLKLGTLRIEGSPAFAIGAGPTPGGDGFEEGSLPVVLTYSPFFADTGDDGELVIPSNDPDEPEIRVGLTGNGGGDGVGYPQAVLTDCPAVVEINGPEVITLDATPSTDPADALPLTYSWQTTRVPAGSATSIDILDGDDPTVDIPIDVAGAYDVLLSVRNAEGTPSAPTLCTLDVVPLDDIRVELSWDGGFADLDTRCARLGGAGSPPRLGAECEPSLTTLSRRTP